MIYESPLPAADLVRSRSLLLSTLLITHLSRDARIMGQGKEGEDECPSQQFELSLVLNKDSLYKYILPFRISGEGPTSKPNKFVINEGFFC